MYPHLGIDPTATHTARAFALGTVGSDHLGRVFKYVEADDDITAGMCCIIHGDHGAEGVDSTLSAVDAGYGKQCGVAMADIADGAFGWLCVFGTGADILVDVSSEAADFFRLRPTATVGELDDTDTHTEPYVRGLVITTAAAAEAGEQEVAILRWPYLEKNLTE